MGVRRETASVDGDDRVSLVVIDRVDRRNALDVEHCELLGEAFTAAVEDGARAIVITGEAPAFCAGADFAVVADPAFRVALYAMLETISGSPVPSIAAIDGAAIGAGLQLAIACDLRVVGSDARFGLPTARLGLAVDPWTIRRLAALTSGGIARRLLLACETIDHDAASAGGLVDRPGELSDAIELAADLATMAPVTLAYNKRVLASVEQTTEQRELTAAFEECFASADLQEGLAARNERRPPQFEGR